VKGHQVLRHIIAEANQLLYIDIIWPVLSVNTVISIKMDLFDELENLAINAAYEEPKENGDTYDPTQGTIRMWKDRFGYAHEEAMAILESPKATMNQSTSRQERMLSPAQARSVYLVKLEGPISTAASVQIAGSLPTVPEPYQGSSDEGNTSFCKVTGQTKMAIENWISAQRGPIFRPLFVPVGMAYKELSSQSLYPTLGKDTILPHFRPQNPHLLEVAPSFGRTQYQYQVWYFFYGTLASVSKLSSLLSLWTMKFRPYARPVLPVDNWKHGGRESTRHLSMGQRRAVSRDPRTW
jgi:hypothetical protein